jgi:hypothetical protein
MFRTDSIWACSISVGAWSLGEGPAKRQHYQASLSHNDADKALVEQLAKELERRRLSCWLDRWNLISGNSWQTTIGVALGPGYRRTTP